MLRETNALGINSDDWIWLSAKLFTFLGDSSSEKLYEKRKSLAGGEEDNGLEIWRKLNSDHVAGGGGAACIALNGRRVSCMKFL